MTRSESTYPLSVLDDADGLRMAWEKGWLDEFSDEHFLIKAIEKRLEYYPSQFMTPSCFPPLCQITPDNFQENFCMNFSLKITWLIERFGEDGIRRFFTDQLSAGKSHYDEDQFFRALSEVSVLSFLGTNASRCVYEPKTNGRKNPEARLYMGNENTVDVEVKMPGFSSFEGLRDSVIPTVLLDDQGRREFESFCESNGLNGAMPRVMKIKDFLNSAASKFEEVDHVQHMNLLYINWTLSEFADSGFEEAFALMAHPVNGILVHKGIGLALGVDEEVYDKITAVVVYTESLYGLMFVDLRYIWQRVDGLQPHFGIIPLHNSDRLFDITGINPNAPQLAPIMTGHFQDESHIAELMDLIRNHMLKPE